MFDLDSHLMEPVDFLVDHASADLRERLRLSGVPEQPAFDPEWGAPGSFDRTERGAWMAERGIERQLVLPGLSHVSFLGTDLVLDAARTQHRAARAWADGDHRFEMAACVPIDEPEAAAALVDDAATLGFRAVLLTTAARRPPTPLMLEPVWAALEDTGAVGVLHFGTTGTGLPSGWRAVASEGSSEAADPIDVVCAHHGAEATIARLALSGVLDRRPRLRLLTAEHGAAWVPGLLVSLDACQRAFRRQDPAIPQGEPLSSQVRRALTVTPFVFERVDVIQDQVGDELLAFATDHPHPEGGRNPAATFTTALGERNGEAFFRSNALALFPDA